MKKFVCVLGAIGLIVSAFAQKKLTVFADRPTATVAPTMWGIFFEDINFGADGGLYAEMVKNRSFEFPMPMTGWKELRSGNAFGKTLIVNSGKEGAINPRFATITVDAQTGGYGLTNEGFRGMGFAKGDTYLFSVAAKAVTDGKLRMRIEAVNAAGKKIGEAVIDNFGSGEWKTYNASFITTDSADKGRLNVWLEGLGEVQLDNISLFPKATWKNRPNGLRKDLVQWLADLQPGFIRFPGGCIVEGRDLTSRYQWKNTVGPVNQRPLTINRWNNEMRNRQAPDYFQTFGLGFYEYFLLAEDLGAEPVPILNCGMACQFNSAEVVAMNELDPYLQDALDLIEFANGDVATRWGKLRSDMGHPAPFNLKLLGIGNENWGPEYIERLQIFTKAIKEKYPQIQLVGSTGTDPHFKPFSQEGFDFLDGALRGLKIDIMDEHFYRSPDWFAAAAGRYDNYDRKGPKIFAGEYAAHTKSGAGGEKMNNWESALAEAAFMTGLERNADVVTMASYAPLFAHTDAWQWAPDMIWMDNLRSYGTPNYYVQKLFSTARGTHAVPIVDNGKAIKGQDSLYASAVMDKTSGELIVKLVNTSMKTMVVETALKGTTAGKTASLQTMSSSDDNSVNSFTSPVAITPISETMELKKNFIQLSLKPSSLTVIRIPVNVKG